MHDSFINLRDKLIVVKEVNRAANTSSIKKAGILSERQAP
jgi:hypothetical protein